MDRAKQSPRVLIRGKTRREPLTSVNTSFAHTYVKSN
jgi:hypothetical protein